MILTGIYIVVEYIQDDYLCSQAGAWEQGSNESFGQAEAFKKVNIPRVLKQSPSFTSFSKARIRPSQEGNLFASAAKQSQRQEFLKYITKCIVIALLLIYIKNFYLPGSSVSNFFHWSRE
jgi:hypothetical protein